MLGCHDGIPLLDLKGLLPEEEIQSLIDRIVSRGGMVKNLHGQKNLYYQVNATYYSALGESDEKMLLARAIQMFMPGKPQVWYLDLFVGKNDQMCIRDSCTCNPDPFDCRICDRTRYGKKKKLPIYLSVYCQWHVCSVLHFNDAVGKADSTDGTWKPCRRHSVVPGILYANERPSLQWVLKKYSDSAGRGCRY